MALSAIALCSRALLRLGARSIASFDEGTAEAEVCANLYPVARDALLSAHPWNFATGQARLARLSAVPVADFSHAFQLPGDFLRVLSAAGGGPGPRPALPHPRAPAARQRGERHPDLHFPAGRKHLPAFLRPDADPPPRRGLLPAADREHKPRRAAREDRRGKLAARPPDRRPGGNAPGHRGLRPHRRPWRRYEPGRLRPLLPEADPRRRRCRAGIPRKPKGISMTEITRAAAPAGAGRPICRPEGGR